MAPKQGDQRSEQPLLRQGFVDLRFHGLDRPRAEALRSTSRTAARIAGHGSSRIAGGADLENPSAGASRRAGSACRRN